MSKISQELKVLLYLNDKYKRTEWIKIKEVADYLEVSDRQARRYLDDLGLIDGIIIETKQGRYGGYHLAKPLSQGFMMPEQFALALSIAMKRNERIEEVLTTLPNYVVTERVIGDNQISNEIFDKLEVLLKAIQNQKEIIFNYKIFEKPTYVQPYKIVYTNKTYYLWAINKGEVKKYDVADISEIKSLGSFRLNRKVAVEIQTLLSRYGISNKGKTATLRVKCKDLETLNDFDKYYEGKGTKDIEKLTYVVEGNSEYELYYPLFRISTKNYVFLDEIFKKNYVFYLENQIRSIKKWSLK